MPSCTLPITTSPGKMVIMYSHVTQGQVHRISWNLIAGVDLTGISFLRSEAERLTDLLAAASTNAFRFTGWGLALPGGSIFYEEPFDPVVPGSNPPASGMPDYRSTTITFVGVGLAPTPGVCHGRSISRLFVGAGVPMIPGEKSFVASGIPALQDFIVTGLNGSLYLPADAYGQQADILGVVPVQFNAAVQRKAGC